jgi:hypothetical protein
MESIDFPPLAWGDAFSETVFVAGCWVDNLHRTTDGGDTWEKLTNVESGKNDVALHPTISKTLYIGSRWDGALKSEDNGETFRVVNQGITALYPTQMATVRGHPDVVYAITDRQEGIYEGIRGGEQWQFIDIGEWLDPVVIAVDPFSPTRLYVGDHSETGWRLHVSEDSGLTWTSHVITAPEPFSDYDNIGVNVLRPDPIHPGLLLAGVDHIRFGPFLSVGGIYSSTDYGENWTYVESGEVISNSLIDLAYDALTPTIVYAATGQPGSGVGAGMLRSTDSGQTWEPTGEDVAELDHVLSIAVEPNPPYRVFAATSANSLYVSENRGISWTGAIDWLVAGQILFTGEEPPVLYAAGFDGLYRMAENGAAMWWERAAGMLGHVPIYSLATVTATDRVFLYAGTTGGYVESTVTRVPSAVDNAGALVNAGVYRYTTLRSWEVYLPLVVKAYVP